MKTIVVFLSLLCAACRNPAYSDSSVADPFDKAFWSHWGDGRAELAGYELVTPRYGELRKGVAVAIFVTEPFSNESRVKADPGKHPKSDEFQVMKLNLIRDFPTGLYDYNLMTSVFVGVEPFDGLPAGTPAKVSFSAQEWCGHVYEQVLFRRSGVESVAHSYFDGEADQELNLSFPKNGISEDALFLWARGLSAPFLKPGESAVTEVLLSLMTSRLQHKSLSWKKARLSRAKDIENTQAPGGTYQTMVMKASIEDGKNWTFYVEDLPPHRLIKWENNEGETGALLKSERLVYWKMNADRFRDEVVKLGLRSRPPKTP